MSFPMGDATGARSDPLSRRYAWQVPIVLDLGVKVLDSLFVGGYLGAAFGAEGSDSKIEAYCRDDDDDFQNDISCSAFTFQIGIQAHYSFEPGGAWNPWVGYGFGYEVAQQTITDDRRSYRETTTVKGFTVAKLMVGADYRAGIGIGPYLEAAIGRFNQSRTEVNDEETHSGTIPEQAFHTWLTLGLRMTVNP
jgi:hypothetical protein